MKTTRNRLLGKTVLALSLLGSAAGVASAQPSISAGIHLGSSGRASVDLGFFYDNLASYGNWIQRPSYGWVWTPSQVSSNWRPYQDGHWVWTDQGWTWISEEPYGWATYHYGRWYDDPEIGWEWVPGTDWAPAWVSFQEGADYVGWAPLPPSYDINVGYNGGYGLSPEAYVFVPERFFLSASLGSYFVPRDRVSVFFGRTRNYTSYRHDGGRIYNQGIPFENVQRFVGRNVPRYQIADLQGGYQQRGGARIAGNRLEIFRPQVQNVRVAPPSSRPTARRAVVSAEQFQSSHPNRAARQMQVPERQGQYSQQSPRNAYQNGRQRQANGQPQDQYQYDRRQNNVPPQGQTPNGRRPFNVQPDQSQNGRQRQQYNPQTDRQYQQQQQQQDQANRRRQYNPPADRNQNQNDQQRPPQANRQQQRAPQQANPQRQTPPQQQQQAERNNQGRRQGNNNNQNSQGRQQQQQQRDRRDRQNQDENRPPGR